MKDDTEELFIHLLSLLRLCQDHNTDNMYIVIPDTNVKVHIEFEELNKGGSLIYESSKA